MARSVSRKSTKKCGPRKHGRKAHMRKGKMVKAVCVKNRKRTMKAKSVKQRGFMDKMKAGYANLKTKMSRKKQVEESESMTMSAMKSKSKSRKSASKSRSRKSASKSRSRKSGSRSGSKSRISKRVLGQGACTSRKMSVCTKDSRCQIRRRPKGVKTCALRRGEKQVIDALANVAGY